MTRDMERTGCVVAAFVGLLGFTVQTMGQVANLRVSELSSTTNQVEITNTGGAFVTGLYPFCYIFDYGAEVPSGTNFGAGARLVFSAPALNDIDSDFWLYSTSSNFANGDNIVHGLKYGPAPNVGRTGLAASEGLWPSANAFCPAPPPGTTLAWDGFGFAPADWYIDETPTLGSADSTVAGSVANAIVFPEGTQDFENMSLGDDVTAISSWVVVDTSATGMFTVRAVNDVLSSVTPRGSSTQWLRIRDQDATNMQNRFYSATIASPRTVHEYEWTYWVNLEATPPAPGAVTKPRLTIQHQDGGFQNAWGIEFSSAGASLVVLANGGTPASTSLYSLTGPTAVGQWVKISFVVSFLDNTVSASINDGAAVSLPINPPNMTFDREQFRFCYRGEGTDNINTMLLDDLSVQVTSNTAVPAASTWGMAALVLLTVTVGTVAFRRMRVSRA